MGPYRGGADHSSAGALDRRLILTHIEDMSPFQRSIVVAALELARRRRGVTPGELAEAAPCSLRAAQRNLAGLAADGVLVVAVPERKGRTRGEWRNVYRVAKARKA